ncbi:MAG: hypothetical protein ACOYOQ_13770 [Microthrixaceae bacterium]
MLILGWNHRGPRLLEALRAQSPSQITVVSVDRAEFDRSLTGFGGTSPAVPGAADVPVDHRTCAAGLQAWLDDEANQAFLGCDHTLVLGEDALSAAVSDAGVLLTLLKLNPGPEPRPGRPDTVVAELRQRPNRRLARQRWADDLVVGDSLVACVLAQYAATPDLTAVFHAVIDEIDEIDDASFEFRIVTTDDLRPYARAREHGTLSSPTFKDVQKWAWERGMIALGYQDAERRPVLNPGQKTAEVGREMRRREQATMPVDADGTVEAVVLVERPGLNPR